MNRAVIIVLDGVGIGELPDAPDYGDVGSNTLVNLAKSVGGLHLPNLESLGLGNIAQIPGVKPVEHALGCFGRMAELSPGKDTITGHWELAGVRLTQAFKTYPEGFPRSLIEAFESRIGRKTLGNKAASGTEIIKELGQQHVETGWPIVYTSADSVFQIACHESVVPVDELYRYCQIARELLVDEHLVARVIARPFEGTPGNFRRTPRRKDFALEPPESTLLDIAIESGKKVLAVGKIEDIFARRGISYSLHSQNNTDGICFILESLRAPSDQWDILMANLVDFDMVYGHRNDPAGFATALMEFDHSLPAIVSALGDADLLIITADHGCDPTTSSTDHSREYVPLLVYGRQFRSHVNLGLRQTFSDVAASVAEHLMIPAPGNGSSFMPLIRR